PQCSFDSSAGLFAVFRALLRLLAPRHPPHALSSLTALIPPSDSEKSKAGIACGPLPARLHSLSPRTGEGRARVTIQSLSRSCLRVSQETAATAWPPLRRVDVRVARSL